MCVYVKVCVHSGSDCFVKLEQKCPPRSQAGRICTVSVPEDPVHNGVAVFNRGFQGAFVNCDLLACATIYHAHARAIMNDNGSARCFTSRHTSPDLVWEC